MFNRSHATIIQTKDYCFNNNYYLLVSIELIKGSKVYAQMLNHLPEKG